MSVKLFNTHTWSSKRGQAGFTLIELLVVTGITAMIMLTATSMFATFLLSSARTNARRQLQAEGNEAIRKIEFVIRNAADVKSTCPREASDIEFSTIDNSTTTLSVNGSNKLVQDSNQLTSNNVRIVPLDPNSYFTCSIAGNTKYIDVAFSLQPENSSDYSTIKQDFKSTVQVRNTAF